MSSYFCQKIFGYKTQNGRFEEIDSLRGMLSVFVFLHHSIIWFNFSKNGVWELPKSYLYIHLGQSSVCMFYMITIFLFVNKLLLFRKQKKQLIFSWLNFYKGRVLRLVPMYLVTISIVFLIVFYNSGWALNTDYYSLFNQIFRFVFFKYFGEVKGCFFTTV